MTEKQIRIVAAKQQQFQRFCTISRFKINELESGKVSLIMADKQSGLINSVLIGKRGKVYSDEMK